MNKVDLVERTRLRTDIPPFRPGDQVKVFVKVREGDKVRDQVFEGIVISRRGGGLRESFTVRKVSFGVGVERTFPIHAPAISKLEVIRHGRVRRAKLYYLRELSGRRAKIDERRTRIQTLEDVQAAAEAADAAAVEQVVAADAATVEQVDVAAASAEQAVSTEEAASTEQAAPAVEGEEVTEATPEGS